MLASSGAPPSSLEGWVCEPKLDGWRAIVEVTDGSVRVTSRNGHDLTDRVPAVHRLAAAGDVVLDGELVHDDGSMRSFYGLLGALHRGAAAFVSFDVLAVGVEVLVNRSYADRRAVLDTLTLSGVAVVPSFPGDQYEDVLTVCERTGMEGVVLKRARSIDRAGQRTSDWRKVKCPTWREHLERRMADHLPAS